MHLFYQPHLSDTSVQLIEEEFRHCTKVLRHVTGETIHLTDGKGKLVQASISEIQKNKLIAQVIKTEWIEKPAFSTHLYIAPTKQMERMEWMVEKCCEIGVQSITFIKTMNAERPIVKLDRLKKKALSALKQSKGTWMTEINEMISFEKAVSETKGDQKMIAAVLPELDHFVTHLKPLQSVDLFVGPEGDFTKKESEIAISKGLVPVNLGRKVLRTETAGLYMCNAVSLINAIRLGNGY